MPLRASPDVFDAIARSEKEILLGIITQAGEIRVQAADKDRIPGHVEWLAVAGITDAIRGFSLLVHGGVVTAIFPLSRLNLGADARLEDEYVAELLRILPTSDDVKMFE